MDCIQSRQLGTVKMVRASEDHSSVCVSTEENPHDPSVCTTTDDNELEEGCTIPMYTKTTTYKVPPCSENYSDIISHYHKLFSSIPGITQASTHRIPLVDKIPVRSPARPIPQSYRAEVRRQITEMLEREIITESSSPYCSPAVFVKKKDGDLRICIDYRRLNAKTFKDSYPLPLPDEVQERLAGAAKFSKLDLNSGYWQVPLHCNDREMSAFSPGPGMGLFQFNVMPFGLTNAPGTFQRMMDSVLRGLEEFCFTFVDDILIFSPNISQHRIHLSMVLDRIENAGLTLRGTKCEIGKDEVEYLGHVFSKSGMAPNPSRVSAIKEWPRPQSSKDVRQFLGLANYYRRFVRNFSNIASPLNRLLQKTTSFNWDSQCEDSFRELKYCLGDTIILVCPSPDKEYSLYTDASGVGIGAVLEQDDRVVAFSSRTLNEAEQRYSTIERECLALVNALKKFRQFLIGKHFTVYCDHKPLEWLSEQRNVAKLSRWALAIQEYDFTIRYRPGRTNSNADALSRRVNINIGEIEPVCITEIIHSDIPEEELSFTQSNDPILSMVLKKLKSSEPESFDQKEFSTMPLQRFKQIWNQLEVDNGILFRKYKPHAFSDYTRVVVVPECFKDKFLHRCHDMPQSGHLGFEKSLSKLKRIAYWVGMNDNLADYIRTCQVCQQTKSSTQSNAHLMHLPFGKPMEFLSVDVLELPLSNCRNRYLLVCVDGFSRWLEAYAMPDQTAGRIAGILVEMFCRLGHPQFLHSDQGRNFESNLIKEICKAWGTAKSRTTAYHPSGNGEVERANRSIIQMLRAFVESRNNWEEYLPLILYAYRTSVNSSTGLSPYFLMYGREPNELSPYDNRNSRSLDMNPDTYHELVRNKLAEAREYVEAKMTQHLRVPNTIGIENPFSIGQPVWLSSITNGVADKLNKRWDGDWSVRDTPSLVTTEIVQSDGRTKVVHVNRLRPRYLRSKIASPPRIEMEEEATRLEGSYRDNVDKSVIEDSTSQVRTELNSSFNGIQDASRKRTLTGDNIMNELEVVTDNDMSEVSTEFTPNITSTPRSVRGQGDIINQSGSTNARALIPSIEKEVRKSTRVRSRPCYLEDYIT